MDLGCRTLALSSEDVLLRIRINIESNVPEYHEPPMYGKDEEPN